MQVSLCHSTVYKVFLQPTGRAYSAYFVSFLLQNSPCSITVIHIAVCLPPALIKALQKHTNVYVNCCEITLLQKLRTACREGRRGWVQLCRERQGVSWWWCSSASSILTQFHTYTHTCNW